MARVIIHEDNPQGKAFMEYVRTLSFVEIDETKKKKTLGEAVKKVGGGCSVDEFCDGVVKIALSRLQEQGNA